MNSEESDDEPLSMLAIKKEVDGKTEPEPEYSVQKIKRKKKKSKNKLKDLKLILKIPKSFQAYHYVVDPNTVEKPADVWLYMKDLNPLGPYSCLLCSEWFINKSKLIVHYILNHKKDYCGICRYFVESREKWKEHAQFHTPVVCSQCSLQFDTIQEQIEHLSTAHNIVHCRFCHFMLKDNQDYSSHLYKKHLITNFLNRNLLCVWEVDYEGSPDFRCQLCSKPKIKALDFFKHYSCSHKLTLRCFSALLSGNAVPFNVTGVNLSTNFLETELKGHSRYGYQDRSAQLPNIEDQLIKNVNDEQPISLSEVKEELISDNEENNPHEKEIENEVSERPLPEVIVKIETVTGNESDDCQKDKITKYTGTVDFDMTLVELVIINKEYIEYIDKIKTSIEYNINPIWSKVPCEFSENNCEDTDFTCPVCFEKVGEVLQIAYHMSKTHNMKSVAPFFCRLCLTCFETETEMERHYQIELAAFQDLWLCQFCETEFENREMGREHLNEHWQELTKENCFSPQLGFKCRFCPRLFWNEPEREAHHYRMHFVKHQGVFYKCASCEKIFSDKVWFSHHHMVEHDPRDLVMSERIVYKCTLCCHIRPTIESMREHFTENHSDARKIYCNLQPCKYKPFSQNKSFKCHVKTCHGPKAKAASGFNECTLCSRKFSSTRAASAHMALAHGPGRFKCKICLEMLQSNDERNIHYLLRHPGRHPYECEHCGKSFLYKSTMYMHKANYHPMHSTLLVCEYCKKEFTRRDSFREHLLIHSGPRHSCSYCPANFAQRSNMLRHERRHTGEKPYQCSYCPRNFADKGACNSHIKMHEGPKFHPCPYCDQRFMQASKLRYHIRKHTGKDLEACIICSKAFTSPYSLKEHMKVHTKTTMSCPLCHKHFSSNTLLRHIKDKHKKVDRIECPLCDFITPQRYLLRDHVLTHSKVKAHKCLICKYRYKGKRSIKKHIKLDHKIQIADIDKYIHSLNPYKLKLKLDNHTMEAIFGPRSVEVPVEDYVMIAPDQIMRIKPEIETYNTDQNVESEDEVDIHQAKKMKKSKKKRKNRDTSHSNDVPIDDENSSQNDDEKSFQNNDENSSHNDNGLSDDGGTVENEHRDDENSENNCQGDNPDINFVTIKIERVEDDDECDQ